MIRPGFGLSVTDEIRCQHAIPGTEVRNERRPLPMRCARAMCQDDWHAAANVEVGDPAAIDVDGVQGSCSCHFRGMEFQQSMQMMEETKRENCQLVDSSQVAHCAWK